MSEPPTFHSHPPNTAKEPVLEHPNRASHRRGIVQKTPGPSMGVVAPQSTGKSKPQKTKAKACVAGEKIVRMSEPDSIRGPHFQWQIV